MDTQRILENVPEKCKKETLLSINVLGLRFYPEYFLTVGSVSFKNEPVSEVVLVLFC